MKSNQTDPAFIESLYRQHGAALLLFATSITGDRSRAQDAVHQLFVKLIESERLKGVQDLKPYLLRSVRNLVLNDLKVRQRNVALDPDSAWFDPPQRDFAEEVKLRRALLSIRADQRQIIILHLWCDLTFAQIGDVLDISSNTAASRFRYGVVKLRETMSAEEKFYAESCANSRK